LIEIGSNTAEKNSAQTNTHTDRQRDTRRLLGREPKKKEERKKIEETTGQKSVMACPIP